MDRAFAHFEKQDREWRRLLFGLRLDPRLDRLRADSRYTDLLKRRWTNGGRSPTVREGAADRAGRLRAH
jgi:hypothetical protein